MSPKQRFQLIIEPTQLQALREIEKRTGARISEQIRRAIDGYLESQTIVPKAEIRKILRG